MEHILSHDSLIRTVLERRKEGRHSRRKKIIVMVYDIKSGKSFERLKRRAEYGEKW